MRTLAVVIVALAVPSFAVARPAHAPETRLEFKVRTAPVTSAWNCPLGHYTGGGYYTGWVNQLWPSAPHGARRQVIQLEAVRHRVPLRLMLGVWGAESSFGRAASHFGLTAWFPGRGTSGNFAYDAHLAAKLLDRLFRGCHGRHSL